MDSRLALLQSLAQDLPHGAGGGGGGVLHVVVGRGLHSSGGDASLPRVVLAHLEAKGRRVTPRPGALDVQLRRQRH